MSAHQIASLALKIVGILSIISSVPLIKTLFDFVFFEDTDGNKKYLLMGSIIPLCLLIILGCILILASGKLANYIVSSETSDETTSTSPQQWQSIAFSVVGLYLIVHAIPGLVQLGSNVWLLKMQGDEAIGQNIGTGTWAYGIGLLFQMIMGLVIFFGSRGLATLWYYFQSARPMGKT